MLSLPPAQKWQLGEKQVSRTQSLELSLGELTSPRMLWGVLKNNSTVEGNADFGKGR